MKPKTKKLKYVYNSILNSKNPNFRKSDEDFESKLADLNYLEDINGLTNEICSKKNEIYNIKDVTIKNIFYKNSEVPTRWRNKIGYQNTIFKIIEGDSKFHEFLSKTDYSPNKQPEIKSHQPKSDSLPNIILPETARVGINFLNKTQKSKIISDTDRNNPSFNKTTFRQRERLENSPSKGNDLSKSLNRSKRFRINVNDELINKNPFLNIQNNHNTSIFHGSITGLSDINTKTKTQDPNAFINQNTSNLRSTVSFRTNANSSINRTKSQSFKKESQFLNSVEYKKIEIKNENVNELYNEINRHGPNYQYCEKCNYKNLEYFKELRPDNAIKLLTFIKEYRKKNSYQL